MPATSSEDSTVSTGSVGAVAAYTSSGLLDHRRYSAVLVVPARSATALMVRFE
jgi:hypothetical protein